MKRLFWTLVAGLWAGFGIHTCQFHKWRNDTANFYNEDLLIIICLSVSVFLGIHFYEKWKVSNSAKKYDKNESTS